MKIAMLTSDYLPNIGGIAAHVFHLSHALVKEGHQVAVINPVYDDCDAASHGNTSNFEVFRIPYDQKLPKPFKILARTAATLKGYRLARKKFGEFDVIHQHDYMETTLAARLISSSTWVWTNHSSTFIADHRRPLKAPYVRRSYQPTSGIITVSEEIQELSRSFWGPRKNIKYIPNGVDTSLFFSGTSEGRSLYGIDKERFVVLCPRRMVEKNGVIYLARAVAILEKLAPDIPLSFVFLGSDNAFNTSSAYIQDIIQTVRQVTAFPIHLLGNIPMEQMAELNRLSDLVVIPSLVEAVSLSALEAMATQRPVIASAVGGLPEIIHHEQTGLLVEPKDPEALAKSIIDIYNNKKLRERIADNGLRLATNEYGWDQIAKRTVDFYKCIAANENTHH